MEFASNSMVGAPLVMGPFVLVQFSNVVDLNNMVPVSLPSGGDTPHVQDITHNGATDVGELRNRPPHYDATDAGDLGNGPPQHDDEVRALNSISEMRKNLQTPPDGPFGREDLTWQLKQSIHGGKPRDIAIIPWKRLPDFLMGEQSKKDVLCTFTKEIMRKCPPGSIQYPRGNSGSELIRYQCCYGPEDNSMLVPDGLQLTARKRKAKGHKGKEKNDTTKATAPDVERDIRELDVDLLLQSPKCKRKRFRRSKKRGCLTNFTARQVYLDTNLCEIQYYHGGHINIRGEQCHGANVDGSKHASGTRLRPKKNQHKIEQAEHEHAEYHLEAQICYDARAENKNASQVVDLSDEQPSDMELSVPSHTISKQQIIDELCESILGAVSEDEVLQDELIAELKSIRGKLQDMISRGIGSSEHPSSQLLFTNGETDAALRQHRGTLECNGKDNRTPKPLQRKGHRV